MSTSVLASLEPRFFELQNRVSEIVHSQPWQFLNILINDASVVVNVGHWQCCFKAVARARRASPRRVLMCLGSLLTWYAAGTYLLRQQSRGVPPPTAVWSGRSRSWRRRRLILIIMTFSHH